MNASLVALVVTGATLAAIPLLLGRVGAVAVVGGATTGAVLLALFGLGTHRGTSPEGGQWGPALLYVTLGVLVIVVTVAAS